METIRKRHSPEFKARVALEAIKERKTINEIAGELAIHPVQVSQWKKIAAEALQAVLLSRARLKWPMNA